MLITLVAMSSQLRPQLVLQHCTPGQGHTSTSIGYICIRRDAPSKSLAAGNLGEEVGPGQTTRGTESPKRSTSCLTSISQARQWRVARRGVKVLPVEDRSLPGRAIPYLVGELSDGGAGATRRCGSTYSRYSLNGCANTRSCAQRSRRKPAGGRVAGRCTT
jgi:hypothetical protein